MLTIGEILEQMNMICMMLKKLCKGTWRTGSWQVDSGNNWFMSFHDSDGDLDTFQLRYRYGKPIEMMDALATFLTCIFRGDD